MTDLPPPMAPLEAPDRALRRALLEIELDGRREWVTVTLVADTGEVRALTSEGVAHGPFVDAALAALGYASLVASLPRGASMPAPGGENIQSPLRTSFHPTRSASVSPTRPASVPPTRSASVPPTRSASMPPERAGLRRESLHPPDEQARSEEPLAAAASAFEDLVTAIVRVGVDEAAEAPSVQAARERLVAASPTPLPLGLTRYLGRLRAGLVARDVIVVARLLDEASRFTAAVRQRSPSASERERLSVMLGPFTESRTQMVSDRQLVELAREWVAGAERNSLERRLLIDTLSGELLLECRTQKGAASLGPCPRVVRVGLGEVDPGPSPRRIRVLQYELSNGLDALSYTRILEHAERDLSVVRARCQRELKAYPGLSEPFVVFAPAHTTRDGGLCFADATGAVLPLARRDDDGRSAALERALAVQEPEWVVGSLGEQGEGLALVPYGVGYRDGSTARYLRLG